MGEELKDANGEQPEELDDVSKHIILCCYYNHLFIA